MRRNGMDDVNSRFYRCRDDAETRIAALVKTGNSVVIFVIVFGFFFVMSSGFWVTMA